MKHTLPSILPVCLALTSVDLSAQGTHRRTHRIVSAAAGLLLGSGLLTVLAPTAVTLALTAVPGDAHADMVPCDPLDCPGDPVYAPQQVAIGRDRLISVAQDEAEDQAAATCPGGGRYDVVRVQPHLLPHGSWRYTLTYRCESPLYD